MSINSKTLYTNHKHKFKEYEECYCTDILNQSIRIDLLDGKQKSCIISIELKNDTLTWLLANDTSFFEVRQCHLNSHHQIKKIEFELKEDIGISNFAIQSSSEKGILSGFDGDDCLLYYEVDLNSSKIEQISHNDMIDQYYDFKIDNENDWPPTVFPGGKHRLLFH